MPEHATSRTLVKSAPELWVQCSDAASLARHLGAFGEIRITKLEPETAVAWEGDDVRGTVTLESSGWGTRVTLTAVAPERVAEPTPAPSAPLEEVTAESALLEEVTAESAPLEELTEESEPVAAQPEPAPTGFWGRLRARFGRGREAGAPPPEPEAVAAPAPEAVPAAAAEPEPEAAPAALGAIAEPEPEAPPTLEDELTILTRALDSLGRAHHRPYSRD